MKNCIRVDFDKSQIIMDKTFEKRARIVGSEEYNTLQNARRDYPTFIVTTRTIKRNPQKESYRGLTYEYMEEYILSHDASKMTEYKEERKISECHSVRYPTVKRWFLKTFPEVARFGKESTIEDNTLSIENNENTDNTENEILVA